MTTPDWLERTSLLMGPDKMERFRRAHVLVVGTGGVGAYAPRCWYVLESAG